MSTLYLANCLVLTSGTEAESSIAGVNTPGMIIPMTLELGAVIIPATLELGAVIISVPRGIQEMIPQEIIVWDLLTIVTYIRFT